MTITDKKTADLDPDPDVAAAPTTAAPHPATGAGSYAAGKAAVKPKPVADRMLADATFAALEGKKLGPVQLAELGLYLAREMVPGVAIPHLKELAREGKWGEFAMALEHQLATTIERAETIVEIVAHLAEKAKRVAVEEAATAVGHVVEKLGAVATFVDQVIFIYEGFQHIAEAHAEGKALAASRSYVGTWATCIRDAVLDGTAAAPLSSGLAHVDKANRAAFEDAMATLTAWGEAKTAELRAAAIAEGRATHLKTDLESALLRRAGHGEFRF
jgi:hypothetical protein